MKFRAMGIVGRVAVMIAAAAAASVPGGCSKAPTADIPVPRRHAYPRIEIPAATYRADTIGSLPVELNEATVAATDSPGWLTAGYRSLNTEIYMTLTPLAVDTEQELIANRVERLSMNTGGAATEVVETVNANGWECTLLVTPSGSPTPVQFLAVDPGRLMLSGSAMTEGATSAPADSIRPVVDMLRRDITHLLMNL